MELHLIMICFDIYLYVTKLVRHIILTLRALRKDAA